MADAGKETKRGPEWTVKIPTGPNRLRRETAFICNIRFRNDLPEIPCDPKLLLPPYNKEEIAAFKLTELEKDLKKTLLFEPDLGIPIHSWNIEQYSIPEGVVPQLHPDDAVLLESDEELDPKRARLRGDAAEISWLLRTKYIASEAGLKRGIGAPVKAGAVAAAAAAAGGGGGENEDPHEARLRQIEAQFVAAKQPLVHWKDPSIHPVEVLPVFPDTLMEGRSCVLATFDNDPLADVDHVARLPLNERARMAQAGQLKSFKPPKGQQFVALLVPQRLPPPGDDEVSVSGGIPGSQLVGDYQWVREYSSHVRLDDKATTYLFRFAGDGTVQFYDLNTKLELRKRKRQQVSNEDEDMFQQPEKVILRLLGAEEDEESQQQNGAAAAGGSEDQQQQDGSGGGGGGWGGGQRGAAGGSSGGGGTGGGDDEEDYERVRADANAALRDVFGDDDDDI